MILREKYTRFRDLCVPIISQFGLIQKALNNEPKYIFTQPEQWPMSHLDITNMTTLNIRDQEHIHSHISYVNISEMHKSHSCF